MHCVCSRFLSLEALRKNCSNILQDSVCMLPDKEQSVDAASTTSTDLSISGTYNRAQKETIQRNTIIRESGKFVSSDHGLPYLE